GNTIAGTEIDESRSGLLGFDFDAPAIANVGPAPATNANAGGVYSNRFLSVLAINEFGNVNPPTGILSMLPFPIFTTDYRLYDQDGSVFNVNEAQDFVFNSIFRAQVTDTNAGFDDADVSNDVRAVETRGRTLDAIPRDPPLLVLPPGDVTGEATSFNQVDTPFDKTVAVRQNGTVLPLVDVLEGLPPAGNNDGNFDNDGYVLDISGGTAATPNMINFAQSGSAITDAEVNLNVIFYDAVGNATNPNATNADTSFGMTIDRTQPEISFRGFVSPLDVSGSTSVTTSGEIRVFDPNLDLDNSYIIVTRFNTFTGGGAPPTTVLVNGVPLDIAAAGNDRQAGVSLAQVGITNSPNFQPLELTFPDNSPNGSEYVVIIRASDLARQLDEGDSNSDDDTLPQRQEANNIFDRLFDTLFGRGNTTNDNFIITVLNP
ncbi:MAG: hypothetical protein AAF267_16235, partial [Deinococcota bacterium]